MKVAFEIPSIPEISFAKIMGIKRKHQDGFTKEQVLMLLRDCANEYSWTPDATELERVDYQPVFVYCNMMRGGNRYSVIEDIIRTKDDNGKSISPYVYTKDRYAVWQTRDGRDSYPVALTSSDPIISLTSGTNQVIARPGRVKGKLYYVRSELVKNLDRVRQNGILFRRRKVRLIVPYRAQHWNDVGRNPSEEMIYGRKDEDAVFAWMYQGRHKHWDGLLDGGFSLGPCTIRSPATPKEWCGEEPYYFFDAWRVANK